MTYLVTTQNNGITFFLRGTVWSFHADRATVHPTREAAQAALVKAKPFMKAAIFRKAAIQESHFYDLTEWHEPELNGQA